MKSGYRLWGMGYGVILLILASCASFNAKAPNNFAEYSDNDGSKFRAISPDGVLYRVSAYEQKSQASVSFWKDAFLLKMKNSNYKQEDSLSITIGGKAAIGYIFSFANSAGSDLYLVAAVPSKDEMIVVEASAKSAKFEDRKKDILDAIGKITID